MTDIALKKNEKWFILGMAFLQGIALLLIWLWVDQLSKARQYFDVILPLYVLAISFPLSMMLLAHQPRKLAFELSAAFSLLAAFCAFHVGDVSYVKDLPSYNTEGLIFQFGFCMVVTWFIAVTFIEHYCQYHHWFNRYASLYDFSWRNAVKLITAGIFTGLFWAALLLLSGLFQVLHIQIFKDIISSVYFIYPATAVAAGLGLSLYDAKQEALSEFKRAILQVLGWLLPLVSLILIAFIATLPFKGLGALWGTGYATSLMLGLLALMVFLLNTAFQDGQQTQYPAWLLKLSNFAVLTMPIYALLCIYALFLRVDQYGWTSDRVWAAGITLIAALYSFGYGYAAFKSIKQNTAWMQMIKPVNVLTAVCLVVLVGLLYSPILSPMRIGVQSQLARLNDGKVTPSVFDFEYLRFHGGQYGDAALHALLADTANPKAATIKPLIEAALKNTYESYRPRNEVKNPTVNIQTLQTQINVYPKGTKVENALYEQMLQDYLSHQLGLCLAEDAVYCNKAQQSQLLAIDLNQDGEPEMVLFDSYNGHVYKKEGAGWKLFATINLYCCEMNLTVEDLLKNIDKQLSAGNIKAEAPKWQNLKVGDKVYELTLNR